MTKQEYFKLLDKYEAGLATQEEERLLYAYYSLFDLRKDGLQDLSERQLTQLSADIRERIDQRILAGAGQQRKVRLWPRIMAVAAAVALIVLGVYFFNAPSPIVNRNSQIVNQNDIAPGKNGATLTLASGKVINLSDSKTGVLIGDDLRYNDNTVVISSDPLSSRANAKDLVASTTKGQTYIFTLPDGTKVWLNAASTLKIPSNLSGTETRKVFLEGEAYFEVFKSKNRAFIVESNGQQVEVLGTHFNVNSYKDEGSVRTTLLEGSVRVSSLLSSRTRPELASGANAKDLNAVVLKPNQQSVISGSNQIAVKEIDPETAVAWKEGFFKFSEERLDEIMMKVSRWYDVEISYAEPALKSRTFNGTVSRFSNVSQLLKKLELTGAVHFKIEGRRIVVDR